MENQQVIFILGILPRSGTHFLASLLCQHPDCEKSFVIEDGLLEHTDLLKIYADKTPRWRDSPNSVVSTDKVMIESFGEAMIRFLQKMRRASVEAILEKFPDAGKKYEPRPYLITKTPNTKCLENFFQF